MFAKTEHICYKIPLLFSIHELNYLHGFVIICNFQQLQKHQLKVVETTFMIFPSTKITSLVNSRKSAGNGKKLGPHVTFKTQQICKKPDIF
jgi:hypothetical protein